MGQTIDCCTDNIASEVYEDLQQTEATVNRQYCLQRCWRCYDDSFIVVDGKVIAADNEDALREQLEAHDLLDGECSP